MLEYESSIWRDELILEIVGRARKTLIAGVGFERCCDGIFMGVRDCMADFRDAGVDLLAEEGNEEAEDCACHEEDEEYLVSGILRGIPRFPRQCTRP